MASEPRIWPLQAHKRRLTGSSNEFGATVGHAENCWPEKLPCRDARGWPDSRGVGVSIAARMLPPIVGWCLPQIFTLVFTTFRVWRLVRIVEHMDCQRAGLVVGLSISFLRLRCR